MLVVALFCMLALIGEEALGVEQKMDVAVQQSGETFIVDVTIDVQVSLDTAWGVMSDFDHMTSILGNLKVSKVISRNGNTLIVRQEGVARYGPLSYSFESDREILLEPTKRILARNLSGSATRMDSETEIVQLNRGVQIKYHAEMVPDSVLARMFGVSFARHEVEEQFRRLTREMTRRQARVESSEEAPE